MSTFRTKRLPLIYSDEFRKAVMEAYPGNEKIKELLTNNNYDLGRYLDDFTNGYDVSISLDTIIYTLEEGKWTNLLELAKDKKIEETQIRFRREVYRMWDKEVFMD